VSSIGADPTGGPGSERRRSEPRRSESRGAERGRPEGVPAAEEPEPPAAGDPVDHLWTAAHEFLAAARAVIDAADAVVVEQQRRAAAPRPPRLRRIDVE
jgi:hypothetical protein